MGLGNERREALSRAFELSPRPLPLTVLEAPPGGGEMTEAGHELVVAEPGGLAERVGRLRVLAPEKMTLGAPEDALEPRLRGRPVVFHEGR